MLIVVNSLELGGAERCTANLCAYWHARGIKVKLVTVLDREITFNLPKEIEVICLGVRGRLDVIRIFLSVIKINLIFYGFKPNIINFHLLNSSLFSLALVNFFKSFLIFSIHNAYTKSKFQLFLYSLVIKRCDLTTFPSNVAYEFYQKNLNCDPNKLTILPNPIIDINRSPSKTQNKTILFLYVGRLVQSKRVDKIISCFSKIPLTMHKANTKLELHIVGDGPEKTRLVSLSEQMGITSVVHFHGNAHNPDVFYGSAKYFISASKHESFGNTYIEAMSHDCTVISYKNEGVKELQAQGAQVITFENDHELTEIFKNIASGKNYANGTDILENNKFSQKYDQEFCGEVWLQKFKNMADGNGVKY